MNTQAYEAQYVDPDAAAARHAQLMAEAVEALTAGRPEQVLHAPAYSKHSCTVGELVEMEANGAAIVSIICAASHSTDPAMRLIAAAWIQATARAHADSHCDAED